MTNPDIGVFPSASNTNAKSQSKKGGGGGVGGIAEAKTTSRLTSNSDNRRGAGLILRKYIDTELKRRLKVEN